MKAGIITLRRNVEIGGRVVPRVTAAALRFASDSFPEFV